MTCITARLESQEFKQNKDVLTLYQRLRLTYREDQLFLLESLSGPDPDRNRSLIGFDPILTVSVNKGIMTIEPLEISPLDAYLGQYFESAESGFSSPISDMEDVFFALKQVEDIIHLEGTPIGPFGMGWFGYFGYDTIFLIEQIKERLERDDNLPLISLTLYRGIVNLDLRGGKSGVTVIHLDGDRPNLLEDTLQVLENVDYDHHDGLSGKFENQSIQGQEDGQYPYRAYDTLNREVFYTWFDKAQEHIARGDVYQLQLGHEILVDSSIPPFLVYQRLRSQDPSPYMYYFVTPQGVHVIGASPELFIGLTQDGQITLRPIAGTVSNPGDEAARKEAIEYLTKDPKEGAEHLMLVDLGRNDLARCCIPETLRVSQLMTTEVYSHVIHMVSNLIGQIRPGLDKYDVFASAFPAGTMTGTPKVRAVEIIEETEVSPRGVYAGAVGFFGFDGMVLTALCIRTASYHSGRYHLRASAGIVEDSQPESEWQETMKKMSSAYLAITGRELVNESLAD